ncbi:MAG: metallophosphoesterase [Williamsia sp.]|nr:metallophosphoesterase [Williamsia sp.]
MAIPQPLLTREPTYGEPITRISTDGKELFVVSDLHLASGLNGSSNYEGTENFFTDDAFGRFMDHLQNKQTGHAILLINGDFVDFLRIRDLPATEEEFTTWNQLLMRTGIQRSVDELRASISKKERAYGLKTHDYKSVWKLHCCMLGHPLFFERVGRWLQDGNQLVITKGNHDLEWYWPAVRHYFRLFLAGCIASNTGQSPEKVLTDIVVPQTRFADHAVVFDGTFYAEHGHRFDSTTAVKGAPLLDNGEEINLPFGSFFNRYLINRLELLYPYLDNVRPASNILLVLLRERFPLALKMLFYYVPFMLMIIPKRLYWETFKYLLSFLFVIVLPILITAWAIWHGWNLALFKGALSQKNSSLITTQILGVLKNAGFLFLSYIFGRILVLVKLKAPWSFYPDACKILTEDPRLKMVTFGHTHNPEQQVGQNNWYYNTGTWIPVYESKSASVRFDKTFTFLHISRDRQGDLLSQPLQRWNDDALRSDPMILTDKK